jgi:putative CRISPR-associated protein (TIGR02619 family)
MQSIIMTVGTSLRTNQDLNLPLEKRRPWSAEKISNEELIIKDLQVALEWMKKIDAELISAETNTWQRLNPSPKDEIILLYSDTLAGRECAVVLQKYFQIVWDQENVKIRKVPGINYEIENDSNALEQMAELLKQMIDEALGNITLAATGGFKAETMVMAIVGNNLGIPVCYVHEEYKSLIYLPYLKETQEHKTLIQKATLPTSERERERIINLEGVEHHRPNSWGKVEKMLKKIPWIEYVRFNKDGYSARRNDVKPAKRTENGRQVIFIHISDNQNISLPLAIETTGYTEEHLEQACKELRERLGRLF